mmetsp:Transcript_23305/g.46395  ORF Transcript_23305/g.46395 Transcript_23305/m.46395 type:complete len:343 (+) Transcript_23305:37-1065(+)
MARIGLGVAVALLVAILGCCVHLIKNAPEPSISASAVRWFRRGAHWRVPNSNHSMFYVDSHPRQSPGSPMTIFLVHGFPSSSYDYSLLFDDLVSRCGCRVVAIDHLGFGFSDKPKSGYGYSMKEQALNMLAFLKAKGLEDVHVVAHDMGDTVLTEALSILEETGLSGEGKVGGFKSVTFTNGGMVFDKIGLRLGQKILLSGYGDKVVEHVPRVVLKMFTRAQLKTIWSPEANPKIVNTETEEMLDLVEYKEGNEIINKLSSYLLERRNPDNEKRWYGTLGRIKIPIRLCWGDKDAVAPIDIPHELVKRARLQKTEVQIMSGLGHFAMLEDPRRWMDTVLQDL